MNQVEPAILKLASESSTQVGKLRELQVYCIPFLPKRDNVTFGSLLSQICLSSITFVRPTEGVETFRNISLQFSTLAFL